MSLQDTYVCGIIYIRTYYTFINSNLTDEEKNVKCSSLFHNLSKVKQYLMNGMKK